MKKRIGFVSNSSSSSFIIDINSYSNVFDIAKHMLTIRNESDCFKDKIKYNELEIINKTEIDPNTPIAFQTINYDTYITRCESIYVIATCNNHPFYELNGTCSPYERATKEIIDLLKLQNEDIIHYNYILETIEYRLETIEYRLQYSLYFWWIKHNIFGKRAKQEEARKLDCKEHYWNILKLANNEYFCTECGTKVN